MKSKPKEWAEEKVSFMALEISLGRLARNSGQAGLGISEANLGRIPGLVICK